MTVLVQQRRKRARRAVRAAVQHTLGQVPHGYLRWLCKRRWLILQATDRGAV